MFDFLKYQYVEISEYNLKDVYRKAEELEKIGYEVVGNEYRKFAIQMRKPKNVTKMFYLNMIGWGFVFIMICGAFAFGLMMGVAVKCEAKNKQVAFAEAYFVLNEIYDKDELKIINKQFAKYKKEKDKE